MTARRLTAATFLLVFAALPASAQPGADRVSTMELAVPASLTTPFKPVVAKVTASTVWVRCDGKDAVLGTIVGTDGYILTKVSELRGKVTVRTAAGKTYDAVMVATHKETDLALLKIESTGLKPVTFADTRKVPVGNWLAAAGPAGEPVSVGVVSVKTRKLDDDDVNRFSNKNRGLLEITFPRSTTKNEPKVGTVTSRDADGKTRQGVAAKAGMKVNDVICEIEGIKVKTIDDVNDILNQYRPGEVVNIKVVREDEIVELSPIKLAKRPLDPARDREEFQNSMGNRLSGRRTGFPAILQTDMIVDPDKCGGPVVDLDGNVVGINIARAGRVETWILPSEVIRPLLDDLKAGKHPPISIRKGASEK
jgi:serine protease Do